MLHRGFQHCESEKSIDLLEKIISIALGGFGALRRCIAFFISGIRLLTLLQILSYLILRVPRVRDLDKCPPAEAAVVVDRGNPEGLGC